MHPIEKAPHRFPKKITNNSDKIDLLQYPILPVYKLNPLLRIIISPKANNKLPNKGVGHYRYPTPPRAIHSPAKKLLTKISSISHVSLSFLFLFVYHS